MDSPFNSPKCYHSVSLKSLTSCQKSNIKEHLVDSNDKVYGIFPFFSPLHLELSLGSRIIDNFSDQFSFNLFIRNKNEKIHCKQLDNMILEVSSSSFTTIVISDASIKNNITISISHMHIANQPLIKILHHAVFITTTKVELFMTRCGINQACSKETSPKSLLSPILSMWLRKYSTQCYTLTKVKLWPSLAIFINFSPKIKTIQSNSGSVLANSTGIYTKQ